MAWVGITAWSQRKASVHVRVWSRALSITRNSIKGFRFWDHCVPAPFAEINSWRPFNEVCLCPVTNRNAIWMWTYFNQISFLDVSPCSVLCMSIHFLASCQVYAFLIHKSLCRMVRHLPINLLFTFCVWGVQKTFAAILNYVLITLLGPLIYERLSLILSDVQTCFITQQN